MSLAVVLVVNSGGHWRWSDRVEIVGGVGRLQLTNGYTAVAGRQHRRQSQRGGLRYPIARYECFLKSWLLCAAVLGAADRANYGVAPPSCADGEAMEAAMDTGRERESDRRQAEDAH